MRKIAAPVWPRRALLSNKLMSTKILDVAWAEVVSAIAASLAPKTPAKIPTARPIFLPVPTEKL